MATHDSTTPMAQVPAPGIPDRVMTYVFIGLTREASPKRLRRLGDQWAHFADEIEALARGRAGVYSIRDGGLLNGERPKDRDSLEVARILRAYASWAWQTSDRERGKA